jgi:hypothetical protein
VRRCFVDPNAPEQLVKAIADVLCNDFAHFRSRVAEWLIAQTTNDRTPRMSAQRPRLGETWVRRRFAAHKSEAVEQTRSIR